MKKHRIFCGGIHLESNSFTPLKTKSEDFRIRRGDQLRELSCVRLLEEAGAEILPSLYAEAIPGGVMALEDFLEITGEILAALPLDGSVDGVFLILHGALEVEEIGSGEAYLASRVREMVGPDVPIAAPLDLHGNNTYTLCSQCNILYGYRTAPHIDVDETRERAARLLLRALDEKTLPWTEILRIPIMLPGEKAMTEVSPTREIIAGLDGLEAVEGVWCASYFAGMPWVDCPQGGASLVVSGAGDPAPCRGAMAAFRERVWAMRDRFQFPLRALPPEEALNAALASEKAPFFLSDSADNVTAGSTGDNAFLLQALLEKGARDTLVAAIIDPAAVEVCAAHQPGDRLSLSLGACWDSKSVRVSLEGAKLLANFEAGGIYCRAALLRTEGVDVLLFDRREPVFTEEDLGHFGLKASDYRIIVVKQGYLTPEFDAIAGDFVMALTPGNCAQDLSLLEYSRIRRPMYPFDRT